ncbi:Card1-like endonuclease domain-containing protein [Gilvimarinus agarilyticus]|uniref:Card1-like endonuclease domain-containing protein n=1 Tax=Gilvimarinus agarilyticus TaxID=679259 RepID=UPI0005A0BF48|nr:DUF1887 family CARF protein [Gilvimarinus agarilyticus]
MQPTHDAQLVIVTDQPATTLCPILDARLRPREIVLITPPETHYQHFALWLKQACQPMGIHCSELTLSDIWDLDRVRAELEAYVDERLTRGDTLVLNNTSSYKPISIISHEVFFYRNLPAFYVQHDQARWLSNPTGEPSFNLEDNVKIPAFLKAHGLSVKSCERHGMAPELKTLAEHWLTHAETYSKAMGILNYYAAEAEDDLTATINESHLKGDTAFTALLDGIKSRNLASLSGNQLVFTSEATRFFACGGWMEQLVYSELLHLKREMPKLQDIAHSVVIDWQESYQQRPVRNELDAVVLYDNRLIVIECKTSRFSSADAKRPVYKLGAMIKHLGGPDTTGIIVSFHAISAKHCERAVLFDVHVCERDSLPTLTQHLRKLIIQSR